MYLAYAYMSLFWRHDLPREQLSARGRLGSLIYTDPEGAFNETESGVTIGSDARMRNTHLEASSTRRSCPPLRSRTHPLLQPCSCKPPQLRPSMLVQGRSRDTITHQRIKHSPMILSHLPFVAETRKFDRIFPRVYLGQASPPRILSIAHFPAQSLLLLSSL